MTFRSAGKGSAIARSTRTGPHPSVGIRLAPRSRICARPEPQYQLVHQSRALVVTDPFIDSDTRHPVIGLGYPILVQENFVGVASATASACSRQFRHLGDLSCNPKPLCPPEPKLPTRSEAERRQLTVMFCDLVGSTALSTLLDPEDLREVIAEYNRAGATVVVRLDGFVARYMGDGILAYFGYPQGHEDDAERAVRAGMDLLAAVS